jgi:hypothetical protein
VSATQKSTHRLGRGWECGYAPARTPGLEQGEIAPVCFSCILGLLSSGKIAGPTKGNLQFAWQRVRFFDQFDYFIAPTAQLFPFDVDLCWPQQIAGKKMTTYHEWIKAMFLITMSGCPALAVPAGFGNHGLPIGIQIVAPNHHEFACLQLAYAYELATNWTGTHLPSLVGQTPARC